MLSLLYAKATIIQILLKDEASTQLDCCDFTTLCL